jgi:hypothetical protein
VSAGDDVDRLAEEDLVARCFACDAGLTSIDYESDVDHRGRHHPMCKVCYYETDLATFPDRADP